MVADLGPDAIVRIDQVWVTPQARELGFGDGLLEAAIASARKRGAGAVEGQALPGRPPDEEPLRARRHRRPPDHHLPRAADGQRPCPVREALLDERFEALFDVLGLHRRERTPRRTSCAASASSSSADARITRRLAHTAMRCVGGDLLGEFEALRSSPRRVRRDVTPARGVGPLGRQIGSPVRIASIAAAWPIARGSRIQATGARRSGCA